jgi:hypothetical protein
MTAPIGPIDLEVDDFDEIALEIDDTAEVLIVAVEGEQGPPGPPGDAEPIFNETPSGVQDGSNTVFTLAEGPQANSTTVYRNGLREYLGVGYTETESGITFTTAPLPDDEITVDYLMEG